MNKKLIITPKKRKGDDGYKVFSIRIKETTTHKIEQIAATTGRSKNELIGIFLAFAIENCEIKDTISSSTVVL